MACLAAAEGPGLPGAMTPVIGEGLGVEVWTSSFFISKRGSREAELAGC